MGNRVSGSLAKGRVKMKELSKTSFEQSDDKFDLNEVQRRTDDYFPQGEYDSWNSPIDTLIEKQRINTKAELIDSTWRTQTKTSNLHVRENKMVKATGAHSLTRHHQQGMNEFEQFLNSDERTSKKRKNERTANQQNLTLKKQLTATQSWHETSKTIDQKTDQRAINLSKFNGNGFGPKPIYVSIDHDATIAERTHSESMKNSNRVHGKIHQNDESPVLRRALKREKPIRQIRQRSNPNESPIVETDKQKTKAREIRSNLTNENEQMSRSNKVSFSSSVKNRPSEQKKSKESSPKSNEFETVFRQKTTISTNSINVTRARV